MAETSPYTQGIDVTEFDAGAEFHPDYRHALEHIYSRLDLERMAPDAQATVSRDLTVYREFLDSLGSPHLSRPVVHVTGTRGKGSTVAGLEAILLAAGYRTGATVSPHLVEVRERIRVMGADLSRDRFADLYARIRPLVDKRPAVACFRTVFELLTALAFHTFREEQVDAALVEVGMGGRLDATNVVDPLLSIVTRVGLDHMNVLGNTVGEIAADKAHIIKPAKPAVIGPQLDEALRPIQARAKQTGSELWRIGHEAELTVRSVTQEGTVFDLTTPYRTHAELYTPLLGAHQAENAAVAVLAADRLAVDGAYDLPGDAIRLGLRQVRWPGRGEILQQDPVVLIDGAHTPQGAGVLRDLLQACWPDRKLTYVLGFNRDKNVPAFLEALRHRPEKVYATAARTPRAMPPAETARLVEAYGWSAIPVPPAGVFEQAVGDAAPDTILVVTGSLYIVGAIRREFLLREKRLATF